MKAVELGVIRETGKCESGINLGGIGTGGVEIRPDGRLYIWNMVNSRPWAGDHPGEHTTAPIQPAVMDADWFVRIAEKGKRPVYRWLFTGHGYALGTASHFWRVHKYFFIKSFPEIRYRAEFPFACLDYIDPELPVSISLRAWSGFVPHDPKDSAIPGCWFDFSFVNKSGRALEVSLVWQQQNLAGYAAPRVVQEHEKLEIGQLSLVDMRGSTAHPEHASSGDICIWARRRSGQRVTMLSGNPYMQNVIWPIHLTGALDGPIMPPRLKHEELNAEPSASAPNKGWLCVQQKLAPRASAEMNLGLSWFFPNHVSVLGTRVGHMYENWFSNAVDVAKYQSDNRAAILAKSRVLPELVIGSTLPASLRLGLLDQLSTVTKDSMYIKNGRFGVQEGHGCCSYNTLDVDHYSSYALSLLMPQLRKTILEMHRDKVHPANGKAYHGFPGTVEEIPVGGGADSGYSRWDVCCQYTLQLYRDTRWAGDAETLKACYPAAKRTMELVASLDFYGIGLPYIQGGITYDHWNMQGVVSFMATVYCAALRALEEMAKVMGDQDTVTWARERFIRAVRSVEKYLWNGSQYLLYYGRRPKGWKSGDDGIGEHKIFDAVKPPQECMTPPEDEECGPGCACHREKAFVEIGDTGLMTDVINGNATAAVMGLGAFLDPDRVRAQLKKIYERNIQEENFCLVNGTYPDGHYLDEWPFMQWQTPWTGTEYFFALQCYSAGLIKEGDHVVDLVYERHVREGMRFDHAECNNHYARPLSIWGAYAARLGLDYDGHRAVLTICPSHEEPYSGALVSAVALGTLDYAFAKGRSRATMEIRSGAMSLRTVVLKAGAKVTKVSVTLNGKTVAAKVAVLDGKAGILLGREVTLKAGSRLQVALS